MPETAVQTSQLRFREEACRDWVPQQERVIEEARHIDWLTILRVHQLVFQVIVENAH